MLWNDPQEQQALWCGACWSLEDKLCAAEGGAREVAQALWRSPEDCECISVIYTDFCFCFFNLIVTMPWFFPLEGRKYLVLILQEHTVERLGFKIDFRFKKVCWIS